jgi:ATP phosphoribosyltransferase regulatory subunit HisZ
VTATVVETGGDPDPAAGEAAQVAFAAGLATAGAAQATETAEEAQETADAALATADAAMNTAIDAVMSQGSCCAHCEEQQLAIAELQTRVGAAEETAQVAVEVATEPAPEPVAPSKPHTPEPSERTAYGSSKWFGK